METARGEKGEPQAPKEEIEANQTIKGKGTGHRVP